MNDFFTRDLKPEPTTCRIRLSEKQLFLLVCGGFIAFVVTSGLFGRYLANKEQARTINELRGEIEKYDRGLKNDCSQ